MATQDPYRLQVAKGDVEGVIPVFIWGVNPDISDGGTEETIRYNGGLQPYRTSAATLYVSSSSNNDDGDSGVSTGTKTLLLEGLDANYNLQSEVILMQGRTQVATASTYIRVFRISSVTVGAQTKNFGDIYVTDSVGTSSGVPTGTVYLVQENANATTGRNSSSSAIYTVPAGYTLYLDSVVFRYSVRINVAMDFSLGNFVTRSPVADSPFVSEFKHPLRETYLNVLYPRPLAIPEKTDIECRALDTNSSVNDGAASFTGLLVKN
jgi:hypothetical protein